MPQILVTAGPTDQQGAGTVMLRERVSSADFESEWFAANLVERLGWAVVDATEVEQGTEVEQESEPQFDRQPPLDAQAGPEPQSAAPHQRGPIVTA